MAGPYAPYRSGGTLLPGGFQEALTIPGQMFSRAADELAGLIERNKERTRQEQLADKAAISMYDAFAGPKTEGGSEGANQLVPGLTRDQLLSMNRNERIGTVKGAYDSLTLKSALAEQRALQQQREAAVAAALQQRQANTALTQAMAAAGTEQAQIPSFPIPGQPLGVNMPGMTVNRQVPITSQRLAEALANNPGAINAQGAGEAIRLATALEPGRTEEDATPIEFNAGGIRGIYSRRTGAIHVTPQPTDRFANELELLSLKGLQSKRDILLRSLPILAPEQQAGVQDQVKELEAEMGRRMSAGGGKAAVQPAAGSGAAAPLPIPKTKAELVKGQSYSTSRGVATWDGEKFVPK